MELSQYFTLQKKRSDNEFENMIRCINDNGTHLNEEVTEALRYDYFAQAYYWNFYALQNYFEKKFNLCKCDNLLMEKNIFEDLIEIASKVLSAYQQMTQKEAKEIAEKLFSNYHETSNGEQEYGTNYYEAVEKLIEDLKEIKSIKLGENEKIFYTCIDKTN